MVRAQTSSSSRGSCDCVFFTAERGGRVCSPVALRDDEAEQGPQECLDNCREQYLAVVTPRWQAAFGDVCTSLSMEGPNEQLWPLYWCDSTFCGVWVNETGPTGQDPNVDLIINECQNIGYHSVYDPGPPPQEYACPTHDSGEGGPCTKLNLPSNPSATSFAADGVVTSTSAASTTTSSSSSFTSSVTPALATQNGPLTAEPSTTPINPGAALASNTTTSSLSSPPANDISQSAKVAIAVCSIVTLLALLCLGVFCLQRRRRQRTSCCYVSNPRSRRDHIKLNAALPPAGSPTPLISPAASASGGGSSLTPPARLRDRRLLLPMILKPRARPSSPPLTPLGPDPDIVFPSSPICSPTTSKLVARHERGPKVYSLPKVPTPAAAFLPTGLGIGVTGTGFPRGSLSSFAPSSVTAGSSSLRNELGAVPTNASHVSGPATSTATAMATATEAGITLPERPPRPHDAPLRIPDLVAPGGNGNSATTPSQMSKSPRGPPPTCGLPPPPPPPPSRPPSPPPAVALATGHAVQGRRHGHGGDVGIAASSDLGDMMEEYHAPGARESWSSWFGSGTGGTGGGLGLGAGIVAGGGVGGGATGSSANVSVLREGELEKLGGRY